MLRLLVGQPLLVVFTLAFGRLNGSSLQEGNKVGCYLLQGLDYAADTLVSSLYIFCTEVMTHMSAASSCHSEGRFNEIVVVTSRSVMKWCAASAVARRSASPPAR